MEGNNYILQIETRSSIRRRQTISRKLQSQERIIIMMLTQDNFTRDVPNNFTRRLIAASFYVIKRKYQRQKREALIDVCVVFVPLTVLLVVVSFLAGQL